MSTTATLPTHYDIEDANGKFIRPADRQDFERSRPIKGSDRRYLGRQPYSTQSLFLRPVCLTELDEGFSHDFSVTLDVCSQARAEFKRQSGWDKIPMKIDSPTRVGKRIVKRDFGETEWAQLHYDISNSIL